ncbi:hypothetical protein HF285_10190 [Acidithiobacillus ferrooxidans F221]|uniref:hypothetical protein n=1 Tax=Acidithiobacillus ferrooxidans TaxID=920 RepID=UPI001C078D7A|nr:hypothetical protein [Acidithiobacillus ferrooxidans]MBU2808615.1 hypothetical protein [Acidithiobacillus ferrooxidans F221]
MSKILALYHSLSGHIETMAGSIAEGAPRKGDRSRQPGANELAIASFQGRHVAEITQKLGV